VKDPAVARRSPKRSLRFALATASALIVGIAAGAVIVKQAGWWPGVSSEPDLAPTTPRQTPGLSVIPADKLWEAYNADATAADRAFRNRPLLVEGTIMNVRTESDGALSVLLNQSYADTLGVWAHMRTAGNIAQQLGKGRNVRLECRNPNTIATEVARIVNVGVGDCQLR
jgi:hypothetical protein